MKTNYTRVNEIRTNAGDLVGYELLEDATNETPYIMFQNGELARFPIMGSVGDTVKIVKKSNGVELVNAAQVERE